MNHFKRLADSNLQSIPPSRGGLIEHINRACLQGGWLWREAVSNMENQDPEDWGWLLQDGKFFPKWHSVEPS